MLNKLSQQEIRFLGCIYRKPRMGHYLMKKLMMDEKEFYNFINGRISKLSLNYLVLNDIGETKCTITPEGRAVYEYARKDFRDDIKYWVTTIIAALALLIALTSLLAQLGLIVL